MLETHHQESIPSSPDVSFIIACFNEEEVIEYTARQLLSAFEVAGYQLQLILVDDGSHDNTWEIIKKLNNETSAIVPCQSEKNEGYGNSILRAIPLCTAPWIGLLPADLPAEPSDVAKLFQIGGHSKKPMLLKGRRRFRLESYTRRIVSITYNILARLLYGDLGTMDLNGNPKILPADFMRHMDLQSKDWFIDFEILAKAKSLGLPVYELNMFAQMRAGGESHVRPITCWEFLRNLFSHRYGKRKKNLSVRPLNQPPFTKHL